MSPRANRMPESGWPAAGCLSTSHFNRRTLLRAAGLGGAAWLTPLAERLSMAHARQPKGATAQSVIVLWLGGGPSQLETFDPHPGTRIGGETRTIKTSAPGVLIGAGLARVAEHMDAIALVRSVTSKEGDHERATYNMKTGFRPDPTLVHPSLGAVVCHQLSDSVEIPRHVSILSGEFQARGGYLGDQFDPFKINDPRDPIPDVRRRVDDDRFDKRVASLLDVVEPEFARGRLQALDQRKTLHAHSMQQALKMMSSEQLAAFNIMDEPDSVRDAYGDSPFGRGCLAAVRLIDVGVRCVEVTLNGWDSHANNHAIQSERVSVLDPAFAALVEDLKRRKLLDHTLVVCGGEFGRTPRINPAGGRDHWPHGFSIALAGGGIRGGVVVGETASDPRLDETKPLADVARPHNVADIHATVLAALGINYKRELDTPVGRPMVISQGSVIPELVAPST